MPLADTSFWRRRPAWQLRHERAAVGVERGAGHGRGIVRHHEQRGLCAIVVGRDMTERNIGGNSRLECETGRASCWERGCQNVEILVVAGPYKKKNNKKNM